MNEAPLQAPKRIAVVAIHGVGDQAPRETARAVASQLLNLNGSSGPVRYDPFEEQSLRITTQPVVLTGQRNEPVRFQVRERSPYITELHRAKQPREIEDLDIQFTKGQLARYEGEGPAAMYETARLESVRHAPSGPDTTVHIFELYWGDISRLGTGIWRVLTELYQLLFEIGSIGRKTVDFALAAHPASPWWQATRFLQSWAVRLWTWSVPILNLLLLAAVFAVLPAYLLDQFPAWQGGIAFTVAFLLAFGGLVLFGGNLVPVRRFWVWAVLPLLILTACIFCYRSFDESLKDASFGFGYHHLLALEWMVSAGGILAWIITLYSRRRPGAMGYGLIAGLLTVAAFLWEILHSANSRRAIVPAELHVVEMIFIALLLSWWAMMAMGFVASGIGIVAAARIKKRSERKLAWDALMTARMSLSIPIAIFMILTIGLYKGLYGATIYLVEGIPYEPFFKWQNIMSHSVAAEDFLHSLIALSAPPLLTLLLLSGLLILALWGLAPAVLSEFRKRQADDHESRRLGLWLTNGLRLFNWCERLLFVTIFIVLPLDIAAYYLALPDSVLLGNSHAAVSVLGALLAVPAVGIVALRGHLEKVAAGLGPLIDVTLDVAAYLREHPRDFTPKARIYARYVSLLRHLCHGGYDALVIVAHSQGTMLTTDLFRFLQKEPDPALSRLGKEMPVYLFTMGSPIRQLCGARFPHLFAWATRNTEYTAPDQSVPNDLPPAAGVDPAALGVKCWVNAYRSADYIGRFLWRSESCAYNWDAPAAKSPNDNRAWNPLLKKPVNVSEFATGNGASRPRLELCLGAGGHTHYFDQPTTDVAVLLDLLITRSAAGKTL